MLMETATNRRALSLMSSSCRAARSCCDELMSWKALRAMDRAVAVCSGVRTVLVAEPTAFTSLKSAVYVGEVNAGGGPGRNWLGDLSVSGCSCAIHGSKNGTNAGGVGRVTPGRRRVVERDPVRNGRRPHGGR